MTRFLVIGLDGLDPDFVETWLPELPNLSALMKRGMYGSLQSIVQPVTPVAWTSMISGRNPGHFGFTDFTYRTEGTYTDFKLIHSRLVRVPTLYTMLPQDGYRVMTIGVPVSYPPIAISNGVCVSCFMAPSLRSGITAPAALQQELLAQTSSPYLLDVPINDNAGAIERDDLARRIKEMDRQRFDIARYLMNTRSWDLMFLVCMGTDRAGHYFMRFQDPQHRRYDADPRYRDLIRNHYRYCDERIGELLEQVGADTVVLIVSDHGMQRLDGKVNINDYLIAQGYLSVEEPLHTLTSLKNAPINWSRTRAWAHGYGGQIYLNIEGREPQGCIPRDQVDAVLTELEQRLYKIPDGHGGSVKANIMRRQDIYTGPYADTCPDLFVQYENLHYTSSDLLGHKDPVTSVIDLGPDDGAHSPLGFFALAGPGVPALGRFTAAHLLDIAPTILELMGSAEAQHLDGRPLNREDDIYSHDDETELTNRLQSLYLE